MVRGLQAATLRSQSLSKWGAGMLQVESHSLFAIREFLPDRRGRGDESAGNPLCSHGARLRECKVTPMLYAASSRALACLETIVHLNAGGLPMNRYLVELEIPDRLVKTAVRFVPLEHIGWDAIPEGRVSLPVGEAWIRGGTSAVMFVPSVIVPEEMNILINPKHGDARVIRARKVRKWTYGSRLHRSQARGMYTPAQTCPLPALKPTTTRLTARLLLPVSGSRWAAGFPASATFHVEHLPEAAKRSNDAWQAIALVPRETICGSAGCRLQSAAPRMPAGIAIHLSGSRYGPIAICRYMLFSPSPRCSIRPNSM
jgi:RES domain-containing protein